MHKLSALLLLAVIHVANASYAADEQGQPATKASYSRMVDQAIAFLRKSQAPDGSFSAESGPAITAIVATGIMRHGRTPDDPVVAKSLAYLEEFAQDDGGIYSEGSNYQNYETCLAILCFSEANRDGRYKKLLDKAETFVKNLQWDAGEGHDESSFAYGGAGYGRSKRADLSNTSFLVDALKATGNGPDDEAIQRALIFISRCQNLESAHNTTPHASKVNDGGFYYTADAGGYSQAGTTPNGGLRSYASMTYAGLKSMIFAGVDKDDQRVKAAMTWIKKNYDLDSNPGMGASGLYYFYHTFAKALDAAGEDTLVDDAGNKHQWRDELIAKLASQQQADGSWINPEKRWLEGDPNLVTAYALLTLSYCQPDAK